MFKVPERYRVTTGPLPSNKSAGNNGLFFIGGLRVIASDGLGWEHVSVSRAKRTPSWDDMCRVKSLFWGEDDLVVQFHPPKSEYVNNHPYCLHLWRKSMSNDFCEVPPKVCV